MVHNTTQAVTHHIQPRSQTLLGLLLGIIFLCTLGLHAQRSPIQVTTQLTPPFLTNLSSYTTAASEKLTVILRLSDLIEPVRQVRLILTIKGANGVNIRSNNTVFGITPITVTTGFPVRLTNIDLRPYFDLANLSGISATQYNNPLPDGLYQFCFQAVAWDTGESLSDQGKRIII